MPRITLREIEQIYPLAKKVYFHQLDINKALDEAENFGMNRGSARDLIGNFKHMVDAQQYTRTNNNDTTEHFLKNIHKDFGINKLINAVKALELHITYYENIRQVNMNGLRKILNKYKHLTENDSLTIYPDEVESDNNRPFIEGSVKQVLVNFFERDQKGRQECINHYGYKCSICNFDFQEAYGDLGKNFIHVHHIKPLAEIRQEYQLDPIRDLRPVCPNCHAMLHRKTPAYSIEEIKNYLINK
jgi:5-methylcytosine-specific restriction protein A